MKTIITLLLLSAAALGQGVNTQFHLENAHPWKMESDVWAQGKHNATYGYVQGVASPSESGSSMKFMLSGPAGSSYSNALFHYSFPGIASAYAFQLDEDLYIDKPDASQALEFAILQRHGNQWYKFSTQCSYGRGGEWRTWSGGTKGHWNGTGKPCARFAAGTFTHLTFEYEIVGGRTHFIAVTQGGVKHYLDTYGVPEIKSGSSETETTHFQMGGNKTQTPYAVWLDNISVKTTY